MKEYPILFSAPMVRAILDGHKTQTRRVVKGVRGDNSLLLKPCRYNKKGELTRSGVSTHVLHASGKGLCPYGETGDRLWVRETWGIVDKGKLSGWPIYEHTRFSEDGRDEIPDPNRKDEKLVFRVDGGEYPASPGYTCSMSNRRKCVGGWRPSIHMPRAASRILLEIVSVRVERLNGISETDALAEGVVRVFPDKPPFPKAFRSTTGDQFYDTTAKEAFADLWGRINGPASWTNNPWVWVIEFKRVNV